LQASALWTESYSQSEVLRNGTAHFCTFRVLVIRNLVLTLGSCRFSAVLTSRKKSWGP